MKRKMKFIICIMAIAMLALVFTGCGSDTIPMEPVEPDVKVESVEEVDIGPEKVKQIILAKVPGAVEASIYEFEREVDDGRVEYEGSLYHNGYEYEFEVDGATGNILKWEIDD